MTVMMRPYQWEIALAVYDSVLGGHGLTFSVEISRQGGKNELSSFLEVVLMSTNIHHGGNIVKASPTFKPQTVVSMMRLKQRLEDWGFATHYRCEQGYIVRLGQCRTVFLSAEESANVVGNTADLLLEIDESQDIAKDKYTKDFKPMAASTNATIVHYGTTWDDSTLLEQTKQANLELERRDGIKRHFRFDWQAVALHNPAYATYVESERQRLGEDHPLFRTQYALLPLAGGGGLFSAAQLAILQGTHARRRQPEPGKTYVAGIDLAGQAETEPDAALTQAKPRNDSTVLTLAEVTRPKDDLIRQPVSRVVEHIAWTGRPHTEAYPAILQVLRTWHPARIIVDATAIGEPVAAFLRQAIGPRVEPFKFTQASKSELGFELLAAVNRGGIQLYAPDNSDEHRQCAWELQHARSQYRANQTMGWGVDPGEGHDDYLMSLALCNQAAITMRPATAIGGVRS